MPSQPSNDRLTKFFAALNKPLPGTSKSTYIINALCVIATLGILAGLCPCSCSMVSERGRRTSCLNNLKQLGTAGNLYAADHDGIRPATLSEFTRYMGGDQNSKLFICASASRSFNSEPPKLISQFKDHPDFLSYDLLSATGLVEGPVDAAVEPVMCDKPGNHGEDGISISFADGHVAWWPGTLSDYATSNALIIIVNTNWLD